MVTVVFTRRHSIGSVALRTAMWSAWSHCALVLGDEIIDATPSGVRRRPLSELLEESSEHIFVEYEGDAEKVWNAALTQLGKPYDYLGVLGIGFRRRWQDDDKWFCSELIAWSFEEAGYPLFRVQHWRVTPQHIYMINIK